MPALNHKPYNEEVRAMNHYPVESPRQHEDCDRIVREVHNTGYLHYLDLGSHAGVHTVWAIIETDNLEHAK